MGGTGLEPVTPSLSIRGGRSRPCAPVRLTRMVARNPLAMFGRGERAGTSDVATVTTRSRCDRGGREATQPWRFSDLAWSAQRTTRAGDWPPPYEKREAVCEQRWNMAQVATTPTTTASGRLRFAKCRYASESRAAQLPEMTPSCCIRSRRSSLSQYSRISPFSARQMSLPRKRTGVPLGAVLPGMPPW
jgi:hypothetical protein